MKIELKAERFEKTPCMMKFKERKFLLLVIDTVQFIIILLELCLLFFMMEEKKTETDFISDVLYLVENETSVEWVNMNILLAVLGICLILLALLNINSLLAWQGKKSVGVEKYPWGEESLLREGGGRGTWYFGPGPAQ